MKKLISVILLIIDVIFFFVFGYFFIDWLLKAVNNNQIVPLLGALIALFIGVICAFNIEESFKKLRGKK